MRPRGINFHIDHKVTGKKPVIYVFHESCEVTSMQVAGSIRLKEKAPC